MTATIKNRNFWFLLLLSSIIFFTSACKNNNRPTKIALSFIYGTLEDDNYINWLKDVNAQTEVVVMYNVTKDSIEIVFSECDALLLTGGRDVYPGRYGKEYDTARCGAFDFYRDSLEFWLIEEALDREMPILGVCRGQQILNVALGGTLYVDIPTDINTMVHHRCKDWENCYHALKVLPNNLLSEISGVTKGKVTTNHHQAIDRIAEDFKVLAVANDGIIESVGWKDPMTKPFLMAVQWHPERMDTTNMLSYPIARKFLEEADKFKH